MLQNRGRENIFVYAKRIDHTQSAYSFTNVEVFGTLLESEKIQLSEKASVEILRCIKVRHPRFLQGIQVKRSYKMGSRTSGRAVFSIVVSCKFVCISCSTLFVSSGLNIGKNIDS